MERNTISNSLARNKEGKGTKSKNCAECRRLKIKCDRQIPCSNCQKRGTASICPDGQLLSRGHRLILTNTEELHARIEELTSRIQDLEEALATLQAAHSNDPHPLLRETTEPPTIALGSLMINDNGTAEFYGATSSFWTTIPGDGAEEDTNFISQQPVPIPSRLMHHPLKPVADASLIDLDFPLPTDLELIDVPKLINVILSELPPKADALALVDYFYQGASWQISPMTRAEFITDIFLPCYDEQVISIQGLAMIYATLSLGMLRVETSNYATEAHRFITLSRACLTLESAISNTNVTAVNAMLLHVAYLITANIPHGFSRAEATLGMIVRLAQRIGLHREPSLWGITEEPANKRRRTMWELISINLWMSLMSGRPSLLSRANCDVQIPIDPKHGMESGLKFNTGKYYYSEACLWPIMELALAAKHTESTYQAILKLDTKIREWDLPKELAAHSIGEQKLESNFGETARRIFREITILCLHRSYFARALLETSGNITNSRYSRSILAVYTSACTVLERVQTLYELEPVLIMRFSFFWTHCFSAAVILSALVIRAPESSFTAMALLELDKAVRLFQRATEESRAARGLSTVIHLRNKAYAVVDAYRSGDRNSISLDSPVMVVLGVGASDPKVVRQHQRTVSSEVPVNSRTLREGQLPHPMVGHIAPPPSFEFLPTQPSFGEADSTWYRTGGTPIGQADVQGGQEYSQTLDAIENLLDSHPAHLIPDIEPSTDNIYLTPLSNFDALTPGADIDPAQGFSGNSFQFHPPSDSVMRHVEDPEAALLWETFLREVGIGL